MGVKSTAHLTRKEAEDKYVELQIKVYAERLYRAQAVMMDRSELEDELEVLNDKASGGEGFQNYMIRD